MRFALRQLVVVLTIALALLAAVYATFSYAPFLRVADIAVEGAPTQRHPVILQAAAVRMGEPLVNVEIEAVAARVMDTGLFAAVDVSRQWPDTVTISATPRTPILVLRGRGAALRLVDEAGVDYEEVLRAPQGLPVAEVERPNDPAATAGVATVARSLRPTLRSAATELRADSKNRMSLRVNDREVFWGEAADSHLKAAVLAHLLDTPGVGYIDVSAPLAPVTAAHSPSSASQSPAPSGSDLASSPRSSNSPADSSAGEATRFGDKSTRSPSPQPSPSSAATSDPG